MSVLNTSYSGGGTTDPRSGVTPSYKIGKISGTSMASPQVAGLVACLMETYPHYKQEDVKAYITSKWAVDGQLYDAVSTDDPTDTDDLQGSPNKHAKYNFERPLTGTVHPKKDYNLRPTAGALYPRAKRTVRKRPPE
jgi:subtilisin family serine protease